MPSSVCVDAGILVKVLIQEPDSDRARALWQMWDDNGVERVAPTLFMYEVVSVFRNQVWRGILTPDEGNAALALIESAPVTLLDPPGLSRRAWELAQRFNRPTAYDSYYLALAEMQSCEFWTGDERLFNAVRSQLPWVRWLGSLAQIPRV